MKKNRPPQKPSPINRASEHRSKKPTYLLSVLVAVLAFVCYANTLNHEFVFDDPLIIVRNENLASPERVLTLLVTPYNPIQAAHSRLWRPITSLTYALNVWTTGYTAPAMHFSNALLHVLVTWLVFWVALKIFNASWTATVTAALFAVHPIHTEAVANIVGRAEILAAFFFLLCWWSYLKASHAGEPRRLLYCGSVFAYFLALGSKESAITWLGIMLITDWALKDQLRFSTWRQNIFSRAKNFYAGYFAATLIFLTLRAWVLRNEGTIYISKLDNPLIEAGLLHRVLTSVLLLGKYLYLNIFPYPLSADYSYNQIPLVRTPADARFLLNLLALLFLLGLALLAWRKKHHMMLFSILFFFITASIASNLFFTIGTIFAERLMYLPSLAICLVGGASLPQLLRYKIERHPLFQMATLGLLVVLTPAIAWTVVRNRDWKNERVLFKKTVKTAPHSAKAHNNLGVQYLKEKNFPAAQAEFDVAFSIRPNYPDLLNNIGTLKLAQAQVDEAIHWFERALAVAPRHAGIFAGLAFAYLHKNENDRAFELSNRALAIDPRTTLAYFTRAGVYYRLGKLEEALRDYQKVLEIDPTHMHARENVAAIRQIKANPTFSPLGGTDK